MNSKKHHSVFWFAFILIFIGALLLAGLSTPVTQAGAGLPSRNTPTPVSSPDEGEDSDKDDDKDKVPVGAHIELQVQGALAGAWSVVQWQDSMGGWQNVEGWQGTLDEQGSRRWWVAEKDFSKGLFRWVVTQGPGSSVIETSDPFSLPAGINETVLMVVKLN